MDLIDHEKNIGKIWTALEKLRAVVLGDGSEGHEQRIGRLEDKENSCLYLKDKKEQDSRRGFRVGDVANLIQLAMLGIIVYQLLTRG